MSAEHMGDLKEGAINREMRINTNNMKKVTHKEIVKDLDKRPTYAFSKKTVEYNVPLDKWLIKGYESWTDIGIGALKGVIGRYPRVDLPE